MTRAAQAWDSATFVVEVEGQPPFTIQTVGGPTWALRALVAAGPGGCVPADATGSRWPGYVAQLRTMGLPIEEAPEDARTQFILHARVRRVAGTEAANHLSTCR